LLMHLASLFFSAQPRAIRSLHSFPTRRSSDLRTPVDAILWATGFRHELRHLRPLGLTGPLGGIAMDGTAVAADPRIHLVGHGPGASTIGANRAGRAAVNRLVRDLEAGLGASLDRELVRA